jgi:YbgC/YbaW family acyl-CoA thioester hydrolase
MKFQTQVRYRFGDIDDAGIAYYPKLLHYFHCAFEDWWSDGLGHSYAELMHHDKLGFPAVKIDAEFFAPISYGDEPIIHLGVLKLGTASLTLGFWMTKKGSDKPLCRARIVTAAVDMQSMQKRELPQNWREKFAAFHLEEAAFPSGRSGSENS